MRRIAHAIDLRSREIARTVGLTIPQIVVLASVRDRGEVTTREISRSADMTAGMMQFRAIQLFGLALVFIFPDGNAPHPSPLLWKASRRTRIVARGRPAVCAGGTM